MSQHATVRQQTAEIAIAQHLAHVGRESARCRTCGSKLDKKEDLLCPRCRKARHRHATHLQMHRVKERKVRASVVVVAALMALGLGTIIVQRTTFEPRDVMHETAVASSHEAQCAERERLGYPCD